MDDLPAKTEQNQLLVKTKLFDIDNNIAAALGYVPICGAGVIFSIMWLVTEPKSNRYLRHHAIQSLVLNVAYVAVSFGVWLVGAIIGVVPFIGILAIFPSMLLGVLMLAYFAGTVYMMYCAHQGKNQRIPYISDVADQNT